MGNYAAEYQGVRTPAERINDAFKSLSSGTDKKQYMEKVKSAVTALNEVINSGVPLNVKKELNTLVNVLTNSEADLKEKSTKLNSVILSINKEISTTNNNISDYLKGEAVEPAAPVTKPVSFTATIPSAVVSFGEDLVNYFSAVSISPASFYGNNKDDNKPSWAEFIISKYGDLATEPDNISALQTWLRDNPDLKGKNQQLQMILSSVKDERTMRNALVHLTTTQKAIDGLSLAINAGFLNSSKTATELRVFFPGLGTEDFNKVLMLAGVKKQAAGFKPEDAIDAVFNALAENERKGGFSGITNLVMQSNYGENAEALGNLIKDMSGSRIIENNSIENAKNFYKGLVSDSGLSSAKYQSAWMQFKGMGLSSRLSGETQLIPAGASSPIERNRFDISIAAGFMYAYGKTDYFKSDVFKNSASAFLDTICGVGNSALPTVVPLTMLQSAGNSSKVKDNTLDFFYKEYSPNPDGLMSVVGEVANRVAMFYSRPFGASFNDVEETSLNTRFQASDYFLQQARNLKTNELVDDLIARFVDLSWSGDEQTYIKLRDVYSFGLFVGPEIDISRLGEALKAMGITPTDWKDTNSIYRAIGDFVRQNPSFVNSNKLNPLRIALQGLPQTYIHGIGSLYDRIATFTDHSKFTQLAGTGNYAGSSDQDPTSSIATRDRRSALGNIGVIGTANTGFARGHYTENTNVDKYGENVNSDQIFQNATAELQNLHFGETQIYSTFLDWIASKNTSSTAQQKGLVWEQVPTSDAYYQQLIARMRNRTQVGEMTLYAESYLDNQGHTRFKFDAILRRGDAYYRLAGLDKKEYADELAQTVGQRISLQQRIVENSQWALPIGTFVAGERQQRENIDPSKTDEQKSGRDFKPERFGVVIGGQNTEGDFRLGGMAAKTVDGGHTVIGSYQKRAKDKKTGDQGSAVISAGYLFYGNPQTDLRGRITRDNLVGTASGATDPHAALGMVSYMTEKLYAIGMGGKDLFTGQVQSKDLNLAAGGFIRYGEGAPKVYMLNGQYSYYDLVNVKGFAEGVEGQRSTASGLATVKVGDYEVTLYGLNETGAVSFNEIKAGVGSGRNLGDITSQMQSVAENISQQMGADWNNVGDRPALVRSWTNQIIDILQRSGTLMVGDAFNDLRNQFSVGIRNTKDGSGTKFSIAKVRTGTLEGKDADALYLVNMTSANVSGSTVTFTSGVPVAYGSDTPEIHDFSEKEAPKSILGVKIAKDNVAFGLAGSDFGNPDKSAVQADIGYINEDWRSRLATKFFGKGDHTEAFFVGDNSIHLNLVNSKIRGASSQALALAYVFGTSARYTIGTDYRQTNVSDNLGIHEWGVRGKLETPGGYSFELQGTWVSSAALNDVSSKDYKVNLNFQIPIGR
jgi:hypothetical protein